LEGSVQGKYQGEFPGEFVWENIPGGVDFFTMEMSRKFSEGVGWLGFCLGKIFWGILGENVIWATKLTHTHTHTQTERQTDRQLLKD